MRTLSKFGEFVLDNILFFVVFFAGSLTLIYTAYYAPETVTLDSKHWECMMAVPDKISTKCIEYHYK